MRARTILLVAGMLALTLPASGCMSKAKKHLYKAEDYFENHNYPNAKTELEEAIKLDPELTDAHKSLAVISEFMGQTEQAGREYDIVSRQDPTDTKALG